MTRNRRILLAIEAAHRRPAPYDEGPTPAELNEFLGLEFGMAAKAVENLRRLGLVAAPLGPPWRLSLTPEGLCEIWREELGSKVCAACRNRKPLSSFYLRRDSPDGRQRVCKRCDDSRRVQDDARPQEARRPAGNWARDYIARAEASW